MACKIASLEINRAAAQLAHRVADRVAAETGRPRYVSGSMGPSGKLPSADDPDLSNITFDELSAIFYEQAQGLVEGGVDALLVETSQDILEVRAAIVVGINNYFKDSGNRVALASSDHSGCVGQDAARHRHCQRLDHSSNRCLST